MIALRAVAFLLVLDLVPLAIVELTPRVVLGLIAVFEHAGCYGCDRPLHSKLFAAFAEAPPAKDDHTDASASSAGCRLLY